MKFVQINICPPQDPFYWGFFEIYKVPGTSFQATFFISFFDKKFHFVVLHTLGKFHYQTGFTSQVVHQYMFRVSCLVIWWRNDIWVSENLKFELSQEPKELSKYTFFLVSQVLSFGHIKQASKNVVDTIFN